MGRTILTLMLILAVGLPLQLLAQKEIRGHVYDKETRKPLVGATILLYGEQSVLKDRGVSDDAGNFVLNNFKPGNYHLVISFMGYTAGHAAVIVEEKGRQETTIPLQNTGLLRNPITLNSINVKIPRPVFNIRKDTVEFVAGDFQTMPNASLKNLLQKLPGLTIDMDGNYFFQGKPVNELYIDGRAVFQTAPNSSGDPKKIAEILQAGIVDKVQLADKKGLDGMIEGSKNEKVINITIKQSMKKGINGSAAAGLGTDNRYTAAINANMFRTDKQVITSGIIDNISSPRAPSSVDENAARTETNHGPTTIGSFMGNASFDISKKVKVNTNFTHLYNAMDQDMQKQRNNILPDSNFEYNSSSSSRRVMTYNSIYSSITIQPNDKDLISVDLRGTFSPSSYQSKSSFLSLGGLHNDTINLGNSYTSNEKKDNRFNVTTTYTRRLNHQRGTLISNFTFEHGNVKEEQYNMSQNRIFNAGYTDSINQLINLHFREYKFNGQISYQRPVNDHLTLNGSAKFSNNSVKNNQEALNFDNVKKGYDIVQPSLTFGSHNKTNEGNVSTGVFFNTPKLQAQLNLSYNIIRSSIDVYSAAQIYRQNIDYLSPTIHLSYKIDNYKTLSTHITRETRLPPLIQLLPVSSTANPLYIELGNPGLRPVVSTSMNITYASFSLTGLAFSAMTILELPDNSWGRSVYSDSTGKQISQPVNTKGYFTVNQNMVLGKRFAQAGLTVNYTLAALYNQSNSYINYFRNHIRSINIHQVLSGSWTYKKLLELKADMGLQYYTNSYSIQNNNWVATAVYFSTFSSSVYLPLDLNIGASVTYNSNSSAHQQYTIVNSWLSKSVLPAKSLLLKLYAYDLFRQNRTYVVAQAPTYIEQTSGIVLSRYFMLSATWFFGGKK
ncbi:outer membrane beta-barrel protein [Chitinophaga sp. 212800010-3]|uniref:outer membrane beta-barrel protein n=1 Tax=unclassified Chitinophaga TaxID=2619133 RepID=UPI002DE4CAE3|nr:hypothetical protein [Chitinophaga sp. 212800010-3]